MWLARRATKAGADPADAAFFISGVAHLRARGFSRIAALGESPEPAKEELTMSTDSSGVDLKFRPSTYFGPLSGPTLLLSSIKGEYRRRALAQHLASGEFGEVDDELAQPYLSQEHRGALGFAHPSLMGGEYLPDLGEQEIEIARIAIRSSTGDVTCLYARRGRTRIHYRVVDEYEGETLTGKAERTSLQPLTLSALAKFFLQAFDLESVLDMNELWNDEAQFFVTASSQFYPEFGGYISEMISEWRTLPSEDEDQDEEANPAHA
jgi:hypothetical protein